MEPSLLTPILSPRLLSSFHPGDPDFRHFLEELPFALLQRLAEIDYRKSLVADRTWSGSDSSNHFVFGIPATARTVTIFLRTRCSS